MNLHVVDHDVNNVYNNFLSSFSTIYDKCFPIITKTVKYKNINKPWITSAIIKSTKRKNYLYRYWLCKRTESSLTKYKNYKNKLTGIVRAAEKHYYEKRFSEVNNDARKTWNLIKSIINKNNSNTIDELSINGKLSKDKLKIANKFNDYFVNVGSDLAKKIPKAAGNYANYMNIDKSNSQSFFSAPTDISEIIDIVMNFKESKSTGFDNISPSIIKNIIPVLAQPLVNIFNLSLSSGIFPDALKTAKVVPVFKSDDKSLVNNYRPISVLPIFSKILEKIMFKRLTTYMKDHNFLTDKQYGFREKHSTYMALVDLLDLISKEIDDKKIPIGVFIDLSKAFDTINHEILLNKLNLYGVRGIAHKWFSSYLSNRHQFVQLASIKSSTLQITCGVPQGSILGPLLFIIYINDIVNVSKLVTPIMFADDTNLFFSGRKISNLVSTVNSELDKINTWFKLNKLSLNVKKTNFIMFASKRNSSINSSLNTLEIKIDNSKIEQVHSSKFLGVIINQTLSWNDHIHVIQQKIHKNSGIIRRLSKSLPQSVLLCLYHSLIEPYLGYCNIVWGMNRSTSLDKLFISQKKIVRIITFSKLNTHTKPLFSRLSLLTIYQLNVFQVACFVYCCIHNLLPQQFCSMFQANNSIHYHNTRNSIKLHSISCRLSLRLFTIRIYGVSIWNSLSDNVCNCVSLASFKRNLKSYLLQNSSN